MDLAVSLLSRAQRCVHLFTNAVEPRALEFLERFWKSAITVLTFEIVVDLFEREIVFL